MNNKAKKIGSLVLSSTMLLASAGCNSKKAGKERETIPEDAPWYNSTKVKLENPYADKDNISQFVYQNAVYYKDCIYATAVGMYDYNVLEAVKDPDFDYNKLMISSICEFDLNGKFIREIPIAASNSEVDILEPSAMSIQNDKIRIDCIGGNVNSNNLVNYYAYVDVDNETFDFHEFNASSSDMSVLSDSITVGDYNVCLLQDISTEKLNYTFAIVKDDKIVKTIDIGEELNLENFFVSNLIALDDNTVVFSTDNNITGELDVSAGTITETDKDLNLEYYYFQIAQDGRSFAIDNSGIHTLDENLEIADVIDFNNVNVNVSDASNGQVIYEGENKVIEFVVDYESNATMPDTYIYLYEKADTNPNAGKKILNVYTLDDSISYSQAEALVKFNETNPDYFAKMSYSNPVDLFGEESESEDEGSGYEAKDKISNQLMMDLMNGDGPDVILGGFDVSQLNNPEYLLDLNSFIDGDNGIDRSLYFNNIFEAALTSDGKMYQIPVSFTMCGILAKKEDAGDKAGFSFDEYNDFVDKVCNGEDPINLSSADYLINCLSYGYTEYITDGKINFDTEEFRALAEFAKANLPLVVETEEDESVNIFGLAQPKFKPSNTYLYSAQSSLLELGADSSKSLYGYPSSNGMGPVASVFGSAAISANTDEDTQKASWDFIKAMLDETVQSKEGYGNPVCINAFKTKTEEAFVALNSIFETYEKMGLGEAEIKMLGLTEYPDSIKDDYFEMAEKISCVDRTDTAVASIIYEEMGAYFADQKEIEEVIGIMNDRAQKVVGERASN